MNFIKYKINNTMEKNMKKNLNKKNILMFFSLYITQYLGFSFFTGAFVGILRQNGISLENLGFIYMLGLFWLLRFLWAPFIDSFTLGKWLGHYRGWIIIFQSLMVFILLCESIFNILQDLNLIIILSVFFALFSASQDVALDALVLKTVLKEQRPLANTLKISGGLVGMVLGSGVGLIIYTKFGWQNTMFVLAIITLISLVQISFFKEIKEIKDKVKVKIDFKQYLYFWKTSRRKEWLFYLFIYPITMSAAFALLMPMLIDFKWPLDKIGFYLNIVGYSIGVLVSSCTSVIINKLGKRKVLILASYGQIIAILLLLILEQGYNNVYILLFIVGVIFCLNTPATVVMTTLMMDESSSDSPAAQFAIQHSIFMFSGILFSGLAVSFSGVFSYKSVIIFASFIGIIVLYSSHKLNVLKE